MDEEKEVVPAEASETEPQKKVRKVKKVKPKTEVVEEEKPVLPESIRPGMYVMTQKDSEGVDRTNKKVNKTSSLKPDSVWKPYK